MLHRECWIKEHEFAKLPSVCPVVCLCVICPARRTSAHARGRKSLERQQASQSLAVYCTGPYEHAYEGGPTSAPLSVAPAHVSARSLEASTREPPERSSARASRVCAARVCYPSRLQRGWMRPAPSFARRPSSFLPPVTKIKQDYGHGGA